jgi:Clp amino terminal domain, pathogenicity island component
MVPSSPTLGVTGPAAAASGLAGMEARRLGHHYRGPEHLLLGMLVEAENPVDTDLPGRERRQRILLGLPDHGPHPIKLLVEARGTTLDRLRTAVLSELDRAH